MALSFGNAVWQLRALLEAFSRLEIGNRPRGRWGIFKIKNYLVQMSAPSRVLSCLIALLMVIEIRPISCRHVSGLFLMLGWKKVVSYGAGAEAL